MYLVREDRTLKKLDERGIGLIYLIILIVIAVSVVGTIAYVFTRPRAEFQVEELSLSPSVVAQGESVTAQVKVVNIGRAKGTYTVELEVGGETLGEEVTLGPGESRTVDFFIEIQEKGTFNVSVGDLSESFEVVEPVEFEVSNLMVNPSKIESGESVDISVTVKNRGRVEGIYEAVLKINGKYFDSQEVVIAQGESKTIIFSETIKDVEPGIYKVSVGGEVVDLEVLDFPPNPWITDPSNDSFLYDPVWENIIVSQETVSVRAVDLNSSGDIISTAFEYSTDGNVWFKIGVDNNAGFEGFLFSEGSNRKLGDSGWRTSWDLSGLGEGVYHLRAVMRDERGQTEEITRVVHYDPVPPDPIIYDPLYGNEVSGLVKFKVQTNATDIDFATLELFHGSDNWHQQDGVGGAKQGDVGADGSDNVNNFCAPTATANALAGLGDNSVYPQGKEDNDLALAKALAGEMNTDKDNGTNTWENTGGDNFEHQTNSLGSGIEAYLEKLGIGCSNPEGYEVTYYRTKVRYNPNTGNWYPHSSGVTFEAYNNELRKGEAVVLDIHTWEPGPDGKYGNEDDSVGSGHVITGKGANTTPDAQGNHPITYGDPDDGGSHAGSWEETGGFSRMEYPPGSGNHWIITGMWAVSLKNKDLLIHYGPIPQNPFYTMLAEDHSPEDGWALSWDATGVEDGFYTLTVRMVDDQKHVGTETIVVQVKNEELENQAEENQAGEFEVSNLSVSPSQTGPGEPVNVSVDVRNTGEGSGEYTVKLRVNGNVEQTRIVALEGGKATTVSFTLKKNAEKEYIVSIEDLSDSFEVKSDTITRYFEWTDHLNEEWSWELGVEEWRYENYRGLSHLVA